MKKTKRYFSIKEVAELLGRPYQRVWYAVITKRVEPMYVGAHPALTEKDIEELRKWLNRKT
jgi:hypothetical protein